MSEGWLSIRVELVEGRGEHLWPRPGRIFAASPLHTFADLADAIDDGFARWDRSHLREFTLAYGSRLAMLDDEDDGLEGEDMGVVTLARLRPGEQFTYVFDLGDEWAHLCRVQDELLDVDETWDVEADLPLPYFGWGAIPDQYDRRWAEDEGDGDVPADPGLSDLPPLLPGWGPEADD